MSNGPKSNFIPVIYAGTKKENGMVMDKYKNLK